MRGVADDDREDRLEETDYTEGQAGRPPRNTACLPPGWRGPATYAAAVTTPTGTGDGIDATPGGAPIQSGGEAVSKNS